MGWRLDQRMSVYIIQSPALNITTENIPNSSELSLSLSLTVIIRPEVQQDRLNDTADTSSLWKRNDMRTVRPLVLTRKDNAFMAEKRMKWM
jgi:hypothetical protein